MNRRHLENNKAPALTADQIGMLSFIAGAMLVMIIDIVWRAI